MSSAYHVMNMCDAKEIPYINIFEDEDAASKSTVLNIYPDVGSLTQLLLDYVNASEWNRFTILYESPLWLRRVANILEVNKLLKNRINVRNLDYTTNNEFRPTLQDVRDSDDANIILECSFDSLPIILRQAMQVGLLTKHYRWIISNLDAHSIDLEPYQYSGANITTFRILDREHSVYNPFTKSDDAENSEDMFNIDPESKPNSKVDENCKQNTDNKPVIPTYPVKINGDKNVRFSQSNLFSHSTVFIFRCCQSSFFSHLRRRYDICHGYSAARVRTSDTSIAYV